jgi:cyclophilin family peptidyl-prolyl cis-trans isomerase
VANFVGLAEGTVNNTFRGQGQPYYDGLLFHRVIPGHDGAAITEPEVEDPGYAFDQEIVPHCATIVPAS